jgi:curli production assembly/transport component CsgG|tara:strand:+ start:39 stop:977 length:939 start_codon:yes stop_codon:yes gene_type:complete
MKNLGLVGLILVLLTTGCASVPTVNDSCSTAIMDKIGTCIEEAESVKLPTHLELLELPPADKMPIVAVYGFLDKTGQRKSKDGIASFSTAVTQGGESFLIDALKTAGQGKWFRVVERTSLDALVRERQIVRSAREDFASQEDNKDKDVPTGIQPLLFAGILLDGGIVGYDTNIESGGRGARYLGIGMSNQYRRDVVTVSLRGISTLTGEILLNVQTTKTILSTGGGYDVFRFVDMDTKLVEIEDGVATNEGVTKATRSAIELAVLELIYQGDERGYWKINWPITESKIKEEVSDFLDENELVLVTEGETNEE